MVGVCLVDEYDGALVQEANAAVRRLVGSREVAIVPIDTRLDANRTALRSPVEVESLLPNVETVKQWREPDDVSVATEHMRTFLRSHQLVSAR